MKKAKKHKIIIGLVGEIASGKDTFADYLEKKYNSETISFSQPLRDILDRLYLPQTRENLANLGITLRKTFYQTLLGDVVTKEVRNSKKPVTCLPNIRLESDVEKLKNIKGFVLININVSPEKRYKRILKRSQNVDDKTKTWKQFLKDSKLSTEIQIRKIAKRAKFTIDNNGSHQKMYAQIDEVMKQILKK